MLASLINFKAVCCSTPPMAYQMIKKTTAIPTLATIHGFEMYCTPKLLNMYQKLFTIGDRLSCVSH